MSFKIYNAATVDGNICMSLPAGAMISLTASLEGTYTPSKEFGLPAESKPILWDCNFAAGEFPMLDAARERGTPVVRILRAHDEPAANLTGALA